EVLFLDRFEIGAAALHPEHPRRAPAIVRLGDLQRCVAAPPDDQGGFGTDQARGVDQEVDALEPACFVLRPAGAHRSSHHNPTPASRGDWPILRKGALLHTVAAWRHPAELRVKSAQFLRTASSSSITSLNAA